MSVCPYTEELSCAVCLSIFSDPVTLSCGHSFCRGCVTAVPKAECLQCGVALPSAADLDLLRTNAILHSLALRAKERPQQSQSPGASAEDPWLMCPEHEEQMKLFCVTDQQLACIICRDGEKHDGHKFKPIREAAAALRRDIDLGLDHTKIQINEIQQLIKNQSGEMKKTKELSAELKFQVHRQFETMHQFLRRREDEIMNELRTGEDDTAETMSENLNVMNQALTTCEEQRKCWTHIMEVTEPERFLRQWSKEHGTTSDLLKPWAESLTVIQSPLFQGPYQSHLQFFIWKEMLQVVEPKTDLLTLQDTPYLTMSEDKRSFYYSPQTPVQSHPSSFSFGGSQRLDLLQRFVPRSFAVSSTTEFSSGQHYWEVEVRLRDFWCVGIQNCFLKYENLKYSVCEPDRSTEIEVSELVLKLGLYLNCTANTLTFYDADSMKRLHKVFCSGLTLPVSAYFFIRREEPDTNPLTVCRY